MYRHGHTGIALLAYAPVAYILLVTDHPALALLCGLGVLVIEPLPDWDFRLPFFSHRGVSHSLVAVFVVGLVCAVLGWYFGRHAFGPVVNLLRETPLIEQTHNGHQLDLLHRYDAETFAYFGFFVGVYGILVHLVGDIITVSGIQPLLPFSKWRISVSPLRGKNRVTNMMFLVLGVLVIGIVVVAAVPGASSTISSAGYDFGGTPGQVQTLSLPVGFVRAQSDNSQSHPPNASSSATLVYSNQTTNGSTVTVQSVTLPEGGYAVLQSEGYLHGLDVSDTGIAVSPYLSPGTHHNVTIHVSHSIPSEATNWTQLNTTQPIAIALYHETNRDKRFEHVQNRSVDGPYQVNNGPIYASGSVRIPHPQSTLPPASITFANQTTNGKTLRVSLATLPKGGFVIVHTANYSTNPGTSAIGLSKYLSPGTHHNITVRLLNGSVTRNQTLIAEPSRDTNHNQRYDYVHSGGTQDVEYVRNAKIVESSASVGVSQTARNSSTASTTRTSPTPARKTSSLTTHAAPSSTISTPTLTSPTESPETRVPANARSESDSGSSGVQFWMLILGAVGLVVIVGIVSLRRRHPRY